MYKTKLKRNLPQFFEEQKLSCEGQITIQECKRILETFQNIKSPGNDGIPIECYKACWVLICQTFINCVNESFVKEEMSNSEKQAVSNSNWTEWSTIKGVIARVISKSVEREARGRYEIKSTELYDTRSDY